MDNGKLILKRKIGERVILGDGAITITVLPGHKLAIECPKNISVHRGELFDKIKESRNAG